MSSAAADAIRRWREDPATFVRECFGAEPDAWQIDVLRAFPKHQRTALKAPLWCGHVVPTPSGPKEWGAIKPGDYLFAEDGTPTRVVARHDVGAAQLFRVTFRDGSWTRCTADHEWDVSTSYDRKRGQRRTVTTADLAAMPLRRGPQRLVSIPRQGAAQYPVADLPADPYVFGLWLGNGVANEPRMIVIEPAIRQAIMDRGQPITESASVTKRIGLPGFLDGLRATGVASCRSYEKSIPRAYLYASVEQRLALLRGLMDSDGTCCKNGHTYLATSSPQLAADTQTLARSLGYLSGIMGPYQINDGENRDSYRVTMAGQTCPFLAHPKKMLRWRPCRKGMDVRFIDSVEPDGHGDAMCVEIDHPSHCFQAEDHVVTHNCKGPGKSTVLAWLVWNFLATRLHPKVACVSITADNLRDGLWTELAKWQGKSPFLQAAFEWKAERITSRDHPETWWAAARAWSKGADATQQADALAGLHADNLLFVIDEAGGVPDAVAAAAEAGLANVVDPAKQEAHLLIAGNPTDLTGPLYRATTTERHLWHLVEITSDPDDPKRTPRVSVEWARQQIEKYGKDNPWVLVNVYGRFPPSSANTLLGPDQVNPAIGKHLDEPVYSSAPKIIGVDVARFGDDRTVLFPRQGLAALAPVIMRNADSQQVAARVALAVQRWQADAVFVDGTGGYGAGVIDVLRRAGHQVFDVQFAGKASDPRYANKRAEIWFQMAEWIKAGGALPQMTELVAELTAPTYHFTAGKFQLEAKDHIKERVGNSPDLADALALTFAMPVQPRPKLPPGMKQPGAGRAVTEYDPLA